MAQILTAYKSGTKLNRDDRREWIEVSGHDDTRRIETGIAPHLEPSALPLGR